MSMPRDVRAALEWAEWERFGDEERVEDYINFLEEKERRLTQIEEHLNKAEDSGNIAVVDYFKEFKTS